MKSHPSLNYLPCNVNAAAGFMRRWLQPCFFGVALVTLLWGGCTHATNVPMQDAESELMAVRELMRIETQQALVASRSRLDKAVTASGMLASMAAVSSGQMKLLAIYGVGAKLMAEVLIDNQPYVYMRGRSLPVNSKNNATSYKLAGISGSCIHLERTGDEHTLCLQPTLRAAK